MEHKLGVILSFSKERGYGFISNDKGNIYFHIRYQSADISELLMNEEVIGQDVHYIQEDNPWKEGELHAIINGSSTTTTKFDDDIEVDELNDKADSIIEESNELISKIDNDVNEVMKLLSGLSFIDSKKCQLNNVMRKLSEYENDSRHLKELKTDWNDDELLSNVKKDQEIQRTRRELKKCFNYYNFMLTEISKIMEVDITKIISSIKNRPLELDNQIYSMRTMDKVLR